jgi:chromosome segregation protein
MRTTVTVVCSESGALVTFIRRMEIKGFKSAGTRVIGVNFEKGFTVITGPNGSGKSNIADAILFALGENSPKQLRAANGKLTGLIYDPKKEEGAPSARAERPPGCKVTIQFDNSDRAIPVDSDLVTVTRELHETGENIYYLNGKKTTRTALSEVLDLAGLAPGGLNVVPQGAATRVADLTPDEKRHMIEDVVGIAKFDEKKAEAQRQLSQADQRLEVALARIGEMRSTLDSLDLQRNDLVRFNLLEQQIAWLRAVRTSKKVQELRGKVESLRNTEREQIARAEELSQRRTDFENRISATENEKTKFIVEVRQGGGAGHVDLQFQHAQVENELTDMESNLKVEQENIASLEVDTLPSLKSIVSAKEKEVNASRSLINHLADDMAKLEAKKAEIQGMLDEFTNAGEELRDTIDKKTKQVIRVQSKITDLGEKLNQAELAVNVANSTLAVETKRLGELKLRVDGYSGVLNRLEANTTELFSLYETSAKELSAIDAELSEADKRRNSLMVTIEGASRTLEKASSEVSKEEAYRTVSESVSGERTGQTNLQQFCDRGGVPGYVGRVNQLLRYSSSYSKPVSAVLGRWMSSFVVQDLRSMTAFIKAAKSLKGRAYSVVPLSEVEDSPVVRAGKSPGIIGPLSSVIKCDEEHEGLVNFLAGDTLLVETQAIGYVAASEGVRAVTMDGEIFEPGGRAFSYGYQDVILNILEGLEDLEGVSEIEEAVSALKDAVSKRRAELEEVESNSRTITKERVKRIATVASLKAEADTVTRMASRYRSIFRSMATEYEKQGREVERVTKKLASATERRDSLRRASISLKELIETTQSLRLDEMLREVQSARQDYVEQADALRNRIAEANLRLMRERGSLENVLTRALEENKLDLESALEDYKSAKEFVREAPRRIRELTETKRSLEYQIERIKESSRKSQPVLEEFDSKVRRLKEERDSISRSITLAERELFSTRNGVASTEEKVQEALGSLQILGYSEVIEVFEAGEYLLAELEKEYESVVTAVNRGADRQYRDMYLNYKGLSVRHNELEKERSSIINFIESVESEKRKVFVTAFRRIDEEFRGIFSRLTNGEAWLDLEKPDDIFAGGVLLMARFGTKPPWESLSLSGGEKAVSGVALILAMQGVQSHPFYLFDEIDSHLDAVNSGNLAQFLRQRSGRAQIVAITLRDVFIAQSDATYGVYAAGGVSRLVHYRPQGEVPVAGA